MANKVALELIIEAATAKTEVEKMQKALERLREKQKEYVKTSEEWKIVGKAIEESELNIKILNAESAKTFGQMKKGLKELILEQEKFTAGSAEYNKIAEAINNVEGRIGDLNDGFKTLSGSGVERANASIGLLKEGFASFDFEKIKIGFQGIKSAMSGLVIFALIEALTYLWENWDKVIKAAKDFFNIMSDGERQIKKLANELDRVTESNKALTSSLEYQINLMEAQGESSDKIIAKKRELATVEINELKLKAQLAQARLREIIDNDSITESIYKMQVAMLRKAGLNEQADKTEAAYQQSKRERGAEDVKIIKESLAAAIEIERGFNIEVVKADKDKNDKRKEEAKKAYDDLLAQEQKLKELRISNIQDEVERTIAERDKEISEVTAKGELGEQIKTEIIKKYAQKIDEIRAGQLAKEKEANDKRIAEQVEAERKIAEAKQKALEEQMDADRRSALAVLELRTLTDQNDLQAKRDYLHARMLMELDNTKLTEEEKALIRAKYLEGEEKLVKADLERQKGDVLQFISDIQTAMQGIHYVTDSIKEIKAGIRQEEEQNLNESLSREQSALNESLNAGLITKEAYDKASQDLQVKKQNMEREFKKKAFEEDKKMRIASTAMAGFEGALNAFAGAFKTIPAPAGAIVGGIFAGMVAGLTALQIRNIQNQKFDSGNVSVTPVSASAGGGSSPNQYVSSGISPMQFMGIGQPVTQINNNQNTTNNSTQFIPANPKPTNNNMTVKAEVVETENREVTERVNRLNRESTF